MVWSTSHDLGLYEQTASVKFHLQRIVNRNFLNRQPSVSAAAHIAERRWLLLTQICTEATNQQTPLMVTFKREWVPVRICPCHSAQLPQFAFFEPLCKKLPVWLFQRCLWSPADKSFEQPNAKSFQNCRYFNISWLVCCTRWLAISATQVCA